MHSSRMRTAHPVNDLSFPGGGEVNDLSFLWVVLSKGWWSSPVGGGPLSSVVALSRRCGG